MTSLGINGGGLRGIVEDGNAKYGRQFNNSNAGCDGGYDQYRQETTSDISSLRSPRRQLCTYR